jgi:hypothetical protein
LKYAVFWDVARIGLVRIDVSEKNVTSIFRAERIRERGAASAVGYHNHRRENLALVLKTVHAFLSYTIRAALATNSTLLDWAELKIRSEIYRTK